MGFVSNSSSSSFLIGIGLIKDIKAARERLKDMPEWDYEIVTSAELKDPDRGSYDEPRVKLNKLVVESFDYTEVCTPFNFEKEQFYLVMQVGGGSDSDFSVYDEDGEWMDMNYNIDMDFFSEQEQELDNIFYDKDLIEDGQTAYGAGRNG